MTVTVACQRYWSEVGQHAVRPDAVDRALEWICINLGRDTPLSDVGDAEVARLVSLRRGERVVNVARGDEGARKLVSPATVNRSMTEILRKVIRRAENIWKADVQKIQWKSHILKEPDERIRELRPEEEMALLDELGPIYRALVAFTIRAGLRQANAVLLEWSQVDFGARTITVVAKGSRYHTVQITPAIRELLWAQRGRHEERVWVYDSGEPMTVAAAVSALRRALKRAGIENFRFHDLRHTAATRIVRVSGNLKIAQKLLGHSEIATTARYAHVLDEDMRRAMEAVEEANAEAKITKEITKVENTDAETVGKTKRNR